MNDKKLKDFRQFNDELVLIAGKLLERQTDQVEILSYKDRQDIVTSIDIQIEELIVRNIEAKYPEHNIHSEEVGRIDKGSDYTWIIDPLDGTKEFIREIPLYCSAVCLTSKERILTAAVYDPTTGNLFSAASGQGSFRNTQPIRVSTTATLKDAMLFVYLPHDKNAWQAYQHVSESVYRTRGLANINLSYCWIAQGGYDAHLILGSKIKWWDMAPGLLIAQEAGATVTTVAGESVSHGQSPPHALASNTQLHDALLQLAGPYV